MRSYDRLTLTSVRPLYENLANISLYERNGNVEHFTDSFLYTRMFSGTLKANKKFEEQIRE